MGGVHPRVTVIWPAGLAGIDVISCLALSCQRVRHHVRQRCLCSQWSRVWHAVSAGRGPGGGLEASEAAPAIWLLSCCVGRSAHQACRAGARCGRSNPHIKPLPWLCTWFSDFWSAVLGRAALHRRTAQEGVPAPPQGLVVRTLSIKRPRRRVLHAPGPIPADSPIHCLCCAGQICTAELPRRGFLRPLKAPEYAPKAMHLLSNF